MNENSDKLWAGRASKSADSRVNDFNSSIRFDFRLVMEDIRGSIAHASMLGRRGIIPAEQAAKLVDELEVIAGEIVRGELAPPADAEDIHTFIEAELTRRLGDAGKRLHTARSRNDQVATDFKLWVREECLAMRKEFAALVKALLNLAEKNLETVMPGYTHLQRAQPVTFGHYMLAYAQMFLRDCSRLTDAHKRADGCPLGSGALAGTTHPIDREMTAELLGFSAPCENSLDGVSDRDFALELLADLSIAAVHLSRLAEEIILWSSTEFSFIELDDAFSTGSSIMPQKKNPDVAELVRGKSGRVFGDLTALLTAMKGLPLAYNKDMQEDKEAVFDAVDTIRLGLSAFIPMCETMTVNAERMREAAGKGFINATDCADYLASRGVPFRDAYKAVGGIVKYCIENSKTLETMTMDEYRLFRPEFEEDVFEAISLEKCVEGRCVYGGPAPKEAANRLAAARARLSEYTEAE
ncbi:MAG: argininosuccinate lyase [Eubacteriales bacterium]